MAKNKHQNQIDYVEYMIKTNGSRIQGCPLITWKSLIKSPVYTDNRISLSSYVIRNMVYHSIADDVKKCKIKCDAIVAAPTAGIHIGVSVADILGVPFITMGKEGAYILEYPKPTKFEETADFDTLIASNTDAIIPGIRFANQKEVPFAYVRPVKKHGLENNMEGHYAGQQGNVFMMDYYIESSSIPEAKAAIFQRPELTFDPLNIYSQKLKKVPIDIKGMYILVVEDLFSTSGSAVELVNDARNLGAKVSYITGIFDYELAESEELIKKVNVTKTAFITATTFLDIAESFAPGIHHFRPIINKFLADPRNWTK